MPTLPNQDIQIGWCLIPPTIIARKDINTSAKLLLGRIIGLVSEKGYCYASNKWLGQQIGLSDERVKDILLDLEKKGLITREVIRAKNKEVLERKIFLSQIFTAEALGVFTTGGGGVKKGRGGGFHPPESVREESVNLLDKSNTPTARVGVEKGKEFGNANINLVLQEFKRIRGFEPTDNGYHQSPREVAYNLIQRLTTLSKKLPVHTEISNLIRAFFGWVEDKEWSKNVLKLRAIVNNTPAFEPEMSKYLARYQVEERRRNDPTVEAAKRYLASKGITSKARKG